MIQAAVRVKDFVPNGQKITLKVSTIDNSDSPYEEEIEFTVADFDASLVDLTTVDSQDLKVRKLDSFIDRIHLSHSKYNYITLYFCQ